MSDPIKETFVIFIRDWKVCFTIGTQTFTLDYDPEDEDKVSRQESLNNMMRLLGTALSRLEQGSRNE